jgi:Zn-dependent protease with chaperone function
MKGKILIFGLALTVMCGFALHFLHWNFHLLSARRGAQPRIPKALVLEDYQAPEDARLMQWLCRVEQSRAGRQLDADFVKPLIDDINTQRLATGAIEATPSQFPELDETVRTCARILHMPKPRVFVSQSPALPISAENYADPVVVVGASALQRFKDPAELRFLVARELAHIAAHHVRWASLLRETQSIVENNGLIGKAAESALKMSLSKWVSESRITADRGGLIASQDVQASERALVKLATGFDDAGMAAVNIDEYLGQSARGQSVAPAVPHVFLNALSAEVDSIPERIQRLREYAKSPGYAAIWK